MTCRIIHRLILVPVVVVIVVIVKVIVNNKSVVYLQYANL
jgi:hypothetical protein